MAAHEVDAGAHGRPEGFARRVQGFRDTDSAQDERRQQEQGDVGQQCDGRAEQLDQGAGRGRAEYLGGRVGQRVLGMCLDEALTRHDLCQHDLRGAAGNGVHRADQKAGGAKPDNRQPVEIPGHRHAADGHGDGQFADNVDRQFGGPVKPDTRRQAEEHVRHQFGGREIPHFGWRCVQQNGSRQRQGEQGDLAAQRRNQDRGPQPAIGAVPQEIGCRKGELSRPVARAQPLQGRWSGHDEPPRTGLKSSKPGAVATRR